ncbi:MAG: diacylglycerol kinase family protein [Bacteroidia bacterium]
MAKNLKPDKSQPQKFSVRKRLASFRFAWNGIRYAFVQEHNFRIHIIAAFLVITGGIYCELNRVEWVMLLFAIGFVFVTELFNSAIELLADFISPEENKIIGKLKDICAAAVLIAVIVAVVTGIFVFWVHLGWNS